MCVPVQEGGKETAGAVDTTRRAPYSSPELRKKKKDPAWLIATSAPRNSQKVETETCSFSRDSREKL
jgi:hypothetical protein